MPARLPSSEKKQAPLVQAHAFDHYLLGQCDGRFPIHDARPDMRCPMCLRWLPRSAFTLEHAPQQAEQSRLGPAWVLMSTCWSRNSRVAGSGFEADAAAVTRADEATEARGCRVHGTAHEGTSFDVGWMTSHEPVTLADLKSAYLIAFTVLGYSWATSRRLDAVRRAIENAGIPSSADTWQTCGLVTHGPGRVVKEVIAPAPMVLVVAPDSEFVIALPSSGTVDVETCCKDAQGTIITCLDHPWPLMVRETQRKLNAPGFMKPEDAWDRGLTFHLDRCDEPHEVTANRCRSVTCALNHTMRSRSQRWFQ